MRKKTENKLNCATCIRCELIGSSCKCVLGKNKNNDYGSLKSCYEPNALILKSAITDLMVIRNGSASSLARNGAAILIDLLCGASEDLIRHKYEDVYGRVGYENAGPSETVKYVLKKLDNSESSQAVRIWFKNWQKKRDNAQVMQVVKQISDMCNTKKTAIAGSMVFDGTEYSVIQKKGVYRLISPAKPEKTCIFSTIDNNFAPHSNAKHELLKYTDGKPELEKALVEKPDIITFDEFKKLKKYIPKWDVPFWLKTKVEGSRKFVYAVDGDEIGPVCCFAQNIYLRPFIWVEVKKEANS